MGNSNRIDFTFLRIPSYLILKKTSKDVFFCVNIYVILDLYTWKQKEKTF